MVKILILSNRLGRIFYIYAHVSSGDCKCTGAIGYHEQIDLTHENTVAYRPCSIHCLYGTAQWNCNMLN